MRTTTEVAEAFLHACTDEPRQPEVQRTGHDTRSIGRSRKVGRQATIDEVGHTLGRCYLCASTIEPTLMLDGLLNSHHRQGTAGVDVEMELAGEKRDVFDPNLGDHSSIGPTTSTRTGAHTIDDDLVGTRSRRDDDTTRTHAETIYATTVGLRDETVFGRRQVLTPTLLGMILDLVDEAFRLLFK